MDDMALQQSTGRKSPRRLCGLCLHDHQHHYRSQIHRQKTSQVLKDDSKNSQTQKRQQEDKEDSQQGRQRLARLLRVKSRAFPGCRTSWQRQLH